jgi:hypothetical protein
MTLLLWEGMIHADRQCFEMSRREFATDPSFFAHTGR